MATWCDFAIQNRAPSSMWGSFTGGPPKGVLHTTEVKGFTPGTSYYGHHNWPHFTVVFRPTGVFVYQHIPVDRAARAMVNGPNAVQTNNDSAIQIEIAWTASDAHAMPVALKDAIARLMRWIEASCGVARYAVDGFHFYPPENGHRLGYEPWRMRPYDWDRFNGWCGHQHVPDGNVHGDPGKIDIAYLLGGTPGEVDVSTYFDARRLPGTGAWPNGRFPFMTVHRDRGTAHVYNNVAGTGWFKGDIRTRKDGSARATPLTTAELLGFDFIVGAQGDFVGYVIFAADGGTFGFV